MWSRVEKNNKPRGESPAAAVVSKPKQGREKLKHFADEICKAHNAIEDLEQRIARLTAIIIESNGAERALQDAINADGGIALAAYSSGQTKPTDDISKLVAHAKSSGEAAAAAKTALPHTESLLDNARSQLISLAEQKNAELNRVLASMADLDAQAYEKAFNLACTYHDKLAGYASVAQNNVGEVHLIFEAPKMPRFALPSLGNSDADP
jgi:chromosome segregation ATPase